MKLSWLISTTFAHGGGRCGLERVRYKLPMRNAFCAGSGQAASHRCVIEVDGAGGGGWCPAMITGYGTPTASAPTLTRLCQHIGLPFEFVRCGVGLLDRVELS